MAYVPVTPAEFKASKPQFAAVLDPTVQSYLDMGERTADASWGADRRTAVILATCHLMTLDGLGTDAASEAHADGTAEFQTIKSADLTLTRYAKQASQGSFLDWLNETPCGKHYAVLLRMNRGGPLVATASGVCGSSGYAKDWPSGSYGWPGVFN